MSAKHYRNTNDDGEKSWVNFTDSSVRGGKSSQSRKLDGVISAMDVLGVLPGDVKVRLVKDGIEVGIKGLTLNSPQQLIDSPITRVEQGIKPSLDSFQRSMITVKVSAEKAINRHAFGLPDSNSPKLLRIVQKKRATYDSPRSRASLRALGLRGIGQSRILPDRPDVRALIARVPHLIDVFQVEPSGTAARSGD